MVDLDGASAAPAAPVSATATILYQLAKLSPVKPRCPEIYVLLFGFVLENITMKGIPTEPRAS